MAIADAYAQLVRTGSEFQINSYTTGNQNDPSIGVDADGDFVVAWNAAHEGGLGLYDIVAARFNSTGTLLGAEFWSTPTPRASSGVPRWRSRATATSSSFGRASDRWAGPSTTLCSGSASAPSATPLGSEFQISAYTIYSTVPKIASDPDGDFVVAWQAPDGYSSVGVFARRFSSAGTGLATEFRVNTFTVSVQGAPAVALDAGGDFVIAWESFIQDQSVFGVFAQRFDSAGTTQGIEFQVNSYTTSDQKSAAIAAQADGDFVIAWQSRNQDSSNYGIFARRFTSAGTAQASEFQVNVFTTAYQIYPGVAAGDAGDFVVTWVSQSQDGSSGGVFARRVSSASGPFGPEFQVNSWTSNRQLGRAIDSDGSGDFVIAWRNEDPQDGDGNGVFAQRVSAPPLAILDVDGSGAIEPLADGLLILRHHFGFSGATLTNGAVGANCARCAAGEITAYLNGLGLTLDIDNNSALDPLTDGLLVLRFLFGFTGTTLTNGAVAGNCVTRCDPASILAYLQTLD